MPDRGVLLTDAAVRAANVDHPHTGLQLGSDCARAVLAAAVAHHATEGRPALVDALTASSGYHGVVLDRDTAERVVTGLLGDPRVAELDPDAPHMTPLPHDIGQVDVVADVIAAAFHDHYERLAPQFGYETRRDSAKPWDEVPERNRALMRATVRSLLDAGLISTAAPMTPLPHLSDRDRWIADVDDVVCTAPCPLCGAPMGVACKDIRSVAKRRPAYRVVIAAGDVPGVHVARRALASTCAKCLAEPGAPCTTPTGRARARSHAERLRPYQLGGARAAS